MKRLIELFPPLASIERRIFGVSDGLLRAVEAGEVSEKIRQTVASSKEWRDRHSKDLDTPVTETVASATELPSHISALVRRRVAVSQARFSAIPTAGKIVEVAAIRTPRAGQLAWVMQVPLHVLLDAPAESEALWHGWLVSAETDYASSWDFVLQEQDAPFDPEAGMVQVWNPVRLYMPMAGMVVGQLRAERLQAVRSLAVDFLSAEEPDVQPWPGKIAIRCTSEGLSVATGSPLGGDEDPRRQYQRIYHYAAEAVREPARLAIAELESALSGAAALLRRLVEAAQTAGDLLMPVPRVEVAMGRKISDIAALHEEVPNWNLSMSEPSASPRLIGYVAARSGHFRNSILPAMADLIDTIESARRKQESQFQFAHENLLDALARFELLASSVDKQRSAPTIPSIRAWHAERARGNLELKIEDQLTILRKKAADATKRIARIEKNFSDTNEKLHKVISEFQRAVEESYAKVLNRLATAAETDYLGADDWMEGEAENQESEEQDLTWHDIARIRIVSVTPEGAGELLIISGNRIVTAFLEEDGDKIDMVIVKPGDHPARMTWAAGSKVKLILSSEDGRKIELPLFQSP